MAHLGGGNWLFNSVLRFAHALDLYQNRDYRQRRRTVAGFCTQFDADQRFAGFSAHATEK
jgi:hypothetical protein